MYPYTQLTVARQVDRIREEIRLHGSFVAGCEELEFLREGRASKKEIATQIKQIGQWESWAIEPQPDGTVRFSSLAAALNGSSIPAADVGGVNANLVDLFRRILRAPSETRSQPNVT